MINITNVSVHKLDSNKDSKLLAKASITIDDAFVVNDISIIKNDNGTFVAMPSKKNIKKDEFYDIAHPINTECRQLIQKAVLDRYNAAE